MGHLSPWIAIPAGDAGSCFWGVPHIFWGDPAWQGGSSRRFFLRYPAGGGDVQLIPPARFLSEDFNVRFGCRLALSIALAFGGGSPHRKSSPFMFVVLDAGRAGTVWCSFPFSCSTDGTVSELLYGGKTDKTSYHFCKPS